MRLIRVPLFLAAFITSLLFGYSIGDDLNPRFLISGNHMETMVSPDVTIPENDQFNLLIISVDDLSQPDPNLESIWLAAYAENSSKITLVPIFPSPDNPDQILFLSKSFNMENGYPGLKFWEAVRSTNTWWKGFILTDRPLLINLVDVLGGIQIHNQHMNGVQAVRSIDSWKDDPSIAVNHQKTFIEGICTKIASSPKSNLDEVNQLFDENYLSNKQANTFITQRLDGTKTKNILTCTFPTLTQKSLMSTIVR